jgi:lysophospholipid acyltransferase (LPLAT)-like uncharacterized protein
MTSFSVQRVKKEYLLKHQFMTLASKHGDGKFVGTTMKKLGMISILGSSQDGRKSSRGIDIGGFKRIINGLKNGLSLGITPDGPRGPTQKINGELIRIASISGAAILPTSYGVSRRKQLNTWDRFVIPLPFSKLAFVFDDEVIRVSKNIDEDEIKRLTALVEARMNEVQKKSDEIANSE